MGAALGQLKGASSPLGENRQRLGNIKPAALRHRHGFGGGRDMYGQEIIGNIFRLGAGTERSKVDDVLRNNPQ